MASPKQTGFFEQLLNDKEFPAGAGTPDVLKAQFEKLSRTAASDWIEKAMALPDKDAAAGDNVPAPF